MLAAFAQISPAIKITRKRILPVPGTVNYRKGQKVNSSDVVAEAILPTRHVMVDIVRAFGLSDPNMAEALIKRKSGEILSKNDIIAETGGLFSRIIRTPEPGKIVSIHNGLVLIETQAESIGLTALYSGTILDTIKNLGVVIETSGAVIQAAWGNELTGSGSLLNKAETRTSELAFSSLEVTARGSVLVGGTCSKAEVLVQAAALPIAGLILGTIPASLREKALAQPYPILLTDGFGETGMNSSCWKLLSSFTNKEIIVNGETQNSRPEALVVAPVEDEPTSSHKMFTSGQLVRIHAAPYVGQVGTIEKIFPGLVKLPNGLRVAAASIIMDNNERKTIPVANLDVIGFTS